MGREFASLGHEVVHISRAHPDLPAQEESFGVHYLRVRGHDTPASLLTLKWLDLRYSMRTLALIPADSDIIITNTFWAPLLLRGRLARKVYVDVQRVPKGQMRFYRHVGRLRGCSPAIYEAIKQELPAQAQSLVSYVPNPVPFDVRPVTQAKEKTILFVGRLHPEKGVHVLLQAFALLEPEFGHAWRLLIIGPAAVKDGGGGDAYLQQLRTLAPGQGVEFIGPVYDDATLTDYYAQASIFCYPAQAESGDAAPVAPREAMAYGCVPVVSQIECFTDFIEHGRNSLTFNHAAPDQAQQLAAALATLMRDPLLLQQLSDNAKTISSQFAASVIAQEFLNDFELLCPRKNN